jgi:hypothetical protein
VIPSIQNHMYAARKVGKIIAQVSSARYKWKTRSGAIESSLAAMAGLRTPE